MRLLHTSTYQFHEFFGDRIPNYAILSHRWEEEEVSFNDLKDGKGRERMGFFKIEGCCTRAFADGFQYVWIDTCCIDKTSSAELSEAINSMYLWYEKAGVCYAYLSDVAIEGRPFNHFSESKWFTRGWTLQELLAPSHVVFYDRLWKELGTRFSLENEIALITGIRSLAYIDHACLAEKMSWASRRQTTRTEDMAYCLMGIFGVHMVPIYGEGENAFIRLQLEILSKSDDESLFVWTDKGSPEEGLLATSPKAFRNSGDVRVFKFDQKRPPYSMTNQGLRLELLLKTSGEGANGTGANVTEFMAPLNCGYLNKHREAIKWPIILNLKKNDHQQYSVVRSNKMESWKAPKNLRAETPWSRSLQREIVYVKQSSNSSSSKLARWDMTHLFTIKITTDSNYSHVISEMLTFCSQCDIWSVSVDGGIALTIRERFLCTVHGKHYGALMISLEKEVRFVVVLEIGDYKYAGGDILIPYKTQTLEDTVELFFLMRTRDNFNLRRDRGVKHLLSGWSVCLSLRGMGRQQYLVDIHVSKEEIPKQPGGPTVEELRDQDQPDYEESSENEGSVESVESEETRSTNTAIRQWRPISY